MEFVRICNRGMVLSQGCKVFEGRGKEAVEYFSITSSERPLAVGRLGRSRGKSGAVPADDGTTDFSVLLNELKGRSTKIVMVAFDLLYLNGRDLRSVTLFERKTLLRKIISGTAIQFSESFEIDGQDMFKHACKTGWKAWSLFALVSRP